MSTNELWFQSGDGGFFDYKINDSLIFNDGGSHYLSGGMGGTVSTYTVSYWFKRGVITSSNYQYMFSTRSNGGISIGSTSGQVDEIYVYNAGGGNVQYLGSGRKFRDTTAWYHLVMKVSSGSATVYINGEQLGTATAGSVDTNALIGQYAGGGSFYFDGYIADFHFIDGSALNPTSFGETKYGAWKPIAYSGSYGTNGFHLKFDGNTNDSSGNGNNWTANNIVSTDYASDTPTENYAVLAELQYPNNQGLSQGNTLCISTSSAWGHRASTVGMKTGKWYAEFKINNLSGSNAYCMIGIVDSNAVAYYYNYYPGQTSGMYGYYAHNGYKYIEGTATSVGTTATTGDVIGLAFDADTRACSWYKNGTLLFTQTVADIYHEGHYHFACGTYGGAGVQANFGQFGFDYTPPTGYNALKASVLAEELLPDAMNLNKGNTPQDHFNTVLYTGDSTSNRSITGVGFQPDWLWIKNRSNGYDHMLYDVIRGAGNYLESNTTDAEASGSHMNSFDADGFTVSQASSNRTNYSGNTYVAWNWKAGGSGVSNTDGTITSTVSANPDAGMSIVSYTANATTGATVGHGLTQAPDLVIYKRRDGSGYAWIVYSRDVGVAYNLRLNTTSARIAQTTQQFNSTDPSSSVLTVGSSTGSTNGPSGASYIAYCFTNIEGYCRTGSYLGNASTNGPFVYTGFKPAFVIVKSISTGSWYLFDATRDTTNETEPYVITNASNTEATDLGWDILSNGFKTRNSYSQTNGSGGTFIYIAFADTPFPFATAH